MKLQIVLTAKSHHKYNLWELREHRFVITFAGLMIHDWHNQLSCILAWIDQNNMRELPASNKTTQAADSLTQSAYAYINITFTSIDF